MIHQVKLCLYHGGKINHDNCIGFEPGFNVIIGPNRSGKTEILEALTKCGYCDITKDDSTKIAYLSTEFLNPNLGEGRGSLNRKVLQARAMFCSHGESIQEVLKYHEHNNENCFLVDEPETGQDEENMLRVYEGLQRLANKGKQVIIASHEPIFWRDSNIIELEKSYKEKVMKSRREFYRDSSR